MAKAVICTVCQGNGRIWVPDSGQSTAIDAHWVTCHGCGGKGWIEVSDK